jgi:hypothetical protein
MTSKSPRSRPDRIIPRVVAGLSTRPGVRAVALIGSRGSSDPARVDPYSDADFLVCCDEEERARLIAGDWIAAVGPPVLVFPAVMEDESRVLFEGLFACELHLLTTAQAEALSGPCRIGSYLASGFKILYDPEERFGRLAARVRPQPEEARDRAVASSAFWYNAAYCANLIRRGDLFRASRISNWYLQLFLLDLFYSVEEPDATKYVARKLAREPYEALAATVSRLNRDEMIAGLRRCMKCYWEFQRRIAPDIDPGLLLSYRRIEREIEERLEFPGHDSSEASHDPQP